MAAIATQKLSRENVPEVVDPRPARGRAAGDPAALGEPGEGELDIGVQQADPPGRRRTVPASGAGGIARLAEKTSCAMRRTAVSPAQRAETGGGVSGSDGLPVIRKMIRDNSMVRREALHRIPCVTGRNLAGCSWV